MRSSHVTAPRRLCHSGLITSTPVLLSHVTNPPLPMLSPDWLPTMLLVPFTSPVIARPLASVPVRPSNHVIAPAFVVSMLRPHDGLCTR